MYKRKCYRPHTTANNSNSLMACLFSVSDKNLLANAIGFSSPLCCSCHRVAPKPFVLASVVIVTGRLEL